jgi:hypothetical protein
MCRWKLHRTAQILERPVILSSFKIYKIQIRLLFFPVVNSDTYLEARAGNNSVAPLIFRKTRHADLQIQRWRNAIDIVSNTDLYVRFHGMTDQARYFKMIYTTFYSVLNSNASKSFSNYCILWSYTLTRLYY